jgi:hypothetical protein
MQRARVTNAQDDRRRALIQRLLPPGFGRSRRRDPAVNTFEWNDSIAVEAERLPGVTLWEVAWD